MVVSIEGGVETTSYVATIEEVIDRLLEDVAPATAEEVAVLEELIAETGDAQLTAVADAIQEVAVETQEALAAVLEEATQELEALFDDAGVDIPGIKIECFMTAVDLVEGLGTVTITPIGDEEVTLVVDENTVIEEPIAVGDPVKAKYTLDLLALKVELKDALKLEGTVTEYTPDVEIELDGSIAIGITADTNIKGTVALGDEAEVKVVSVEGTLVAVKIEVEDEERPGGRQKFKLVSPLTSISGGTDPATDPITAITVAGISDLITVR